MTRADKSQLCIQDDFDDWMFRWYCAVLGIPVNQYHRKLWEFVFIARAIERSGLLDVNARGLGFGVGDEPLPGYFAHRGAQILATDGPQPWKPIFGDVFPPLNRKYEEPYETSVVDMTVIPDDLKNGSFDFVWSSCALEHLGSLDAGLQFICESLKCLKPGGISVHTTEFNLSSNDATIDHGPFVLYRRKDIEPLLAGPIDWSEGDGELDKYVDHEPWDTHKHLRLQLGDFVLTSIGLIFKKEEQK